MTELQASLPFAFFYSLSVRRLSLGCPSLRGNAMFCAPHFFRPFFWWAPVIIFDPIIVCLSCATA